MHPVFSLLPLFLSRVQAADFDLSFAGGQRILSSVWGHHPSIAETVRAELSPLLSSHSRILLQGDSEWETATLRYQQYKPPQPEIVVRPAAEADIGTIVRYANQHDIPFMLVNRANSLTSDAGDFRNGIQIDVTALDGMQIDEAKRTVRIEAGVYAKQLVDRLDAQGYVTTTGSASCVGVVGPALGGGHGLLQGHYGLMMDNIVNMAVVLANGTSVFVDATTHPDLWWAMRGAGHNFGIVTSMELKIYPSATSDWYYRTYIFTGDKAEAVFDALNELHAGGTMRKELALAIAVATIIPQISATELSLILNFAHTGPAEDAQVMLSSFDTIEHLSRSEGDVPYRDISALFGGGIDDDLCQKGRAHITTTAGLTSYNATAQRRIFDLYNAKVQERPQLASTKLVHQGYSNIGVLQWEGANGAYPMRAEHLLMYFDAMPPEGDEVAREFAKDWAEETNRMWNDGQPTRLPSTYVNYAHGNESVESMYGYETWRLDRLRSLKERYDPDNRFRYYNPIK